VREAEAQPNIAVVLEKADFKSKNNQNGMRLPKRSPDRI
jgi:hypothetical protein